MRAPQDDPTSQGRTATIAERLELVQYEGGAELMEQLAKPWTELYQEASNRQPFYRPEVIGAYVRAFAPKARVTVFTVQSYGRWVAALPLIHQLAIMNGIPVRQLRSPGNEHTLRFDLLCHPEESLQCIARMLWQELERRPDFDVLQLEDVPQGGYAHELLAMARNRGFRVGAWRSKEVPYLAFSDTPDAQFRHANDTLKSNVRRRTRKAERELGGLRLIRETDARPESLDQFYELEASGWKGKNNSAIRCLAETKEFYDAVAKGGARQGFFALDRLMAGDLLIAMQFAFIDQARYYGMKFCYDERYSTHGPGNLLLNQIFTCCIDDGIPVFDFMGPKVDYMAKWTPLVCPHDFLFVFNRTLPAQAVHFLKFIAAPRLRDFTRGLRKPQ